MRTLATIALVLASTACCRADGPVICKPRMERMPNLQAVNGKVIEDTKKLKAFSMSEIQLDPTPLCTVVADNVAFWQEMLTEAQMCPEMATPQDMQGRENAANMVIMYQQQLAALPCH